VAASSFCHRGCRRTSAWLMGIGDCCGVLLMAGYSVGRKGPVRDTRKVRAAAIGDVIPTPAIRQTGREPAEATERSAVSWVLEFFAPAQFPLGVRSATQPAWRSRHRSPVGFASPAFAGFAFVALLPWGELRV
jgi:hypothetical protein